MNKPILSKTKVLGDDRGLFFPLLLEPKWMQSNVSISKQWTFRGLHHQRGETSQSKLITVLRGRILDFVVDLRKGNFLDAAFYSLERGDQILVPKGFAHGFLVLEDETIIQYLVDAPYSPSTEISFNWKSVELVKEVILAEVGEENNLILSPKDKEGVDLVPLYAEQ